MIASSVTGGDSHCYVDFVELNEPNSVLLTVINEGKWPVYDVAVRIVDVLKTDALKKTAPEHDAALSVLLNEMFQKSLGNLAPKSAVALDKTLYVFQIQTQRSSRL